MKNGRPPLVLDLEVCKRIKSARKSCRITQKELAELLDVSVQTVKNWEQGINGTDDATLKRIAGIFQVDFLWLKNVSNETDKCEERQPHDVEMNDIQNGGASFLRYYSTDQLLAELKRRIEAP